MGRRRFAAARGAVFAAAACASLALVLAPASSMAGEGGVECPAPGDILVADPEAFTSNEGGIIEVNKSTGVRTTVSANNAPSGGPSFLNPYNLARERGPVAEDECEDLFVADAGVFSAADGRVIRVDPLTGDRTLVSETGVRGAGPDLEDPVGIAVESSGDLVVADADAFGGPGGLIRVDPDTGDRTALSQNLGVAPYFFEPYDVATESNGDLLVVDRDGLVAFGSGSVMRVDPTTGGRTTVSDLNTPAASPPDFLEPQGLYVGADVLVADADAYAGSGGGIFDVDPAAGTRTNVSENNSPVGGPSFVDPSDVATRRFNGGTKYVADASAFGGSGGVISLDSAGNRTKLSRNGDPAGAPTFVEPWGIVVVGLRMIATSVTPGTFPVAPVAKSSASGRSRGTTLSYRLFAPARVVFTVHRRLQGRAGRFRCERETESNRTRRSCRRYVRVGSFARQSRTGLNRFRWSGRIGGKALALGRHRITMVAIDRQGNRSDPVSREFRIVRP